MPDETTRRETEPTNILPMLSWSRTITWWPKHDWEQHEKTTFGDDLSPADDGYRLKKIRDEACMGGNEHGANTVVEVVYSSHLSDERPQLCGFSITHNCNMSEEEYVAKDGFKTIDDARATAEAALVRILA